MNDHYSIGYTPEHSVFLESILNPNLKVYFTQDGNSYGEY